MHSFEFLMKKKFTSRTDDIKQNWRARLLDKYVKMNEKKREREYKTLFSMQL